MVSEVIWVPHPLGQSGTERKSGSGFCIWNGKKVNAAGFSSREWASCETSSSKC